MVYRQSSPGAGPKVGRVRLKEGQYLDVLLGRTPSSSLLLFLLLLSFLYVSCLVSPLDKVNTHTNCERCRDPYSDNRRGKISTVLTLCLQGSVRVPVYRSLLSRPYPRYNWQSETTKRLRTDFLQPSFPTLESSSPGGPDRPCPTTVVFPGI